MRHVVIGAGEVGTAIAAVLRHTHDVELRDVKAAVEPAEVLHICFPWSSSFEEAVWAYRRAYRATMVVIHSTVPAGTSRRLRAVHSPVTGRHPDLEQSVRTFTKFFGGPMANAAAEVFASCGVRTVTVPAQETTEAGKLWQTLQFGWLVALQKEGYRYMKASGADPAIAYVAMNEAYSSGYEALGLPFRLPVIDDVPGPIGGHCVIPNAGITAAYLADELVSLDSEW